MPKSCRIWSAPQRQRWMTKGVFVALLTIASLAGAAELPPLGHSMSPVSPPVPAPGFTLQDMDGEDHALGDFRGTVVMAPRSSLMMSRRSIESIRP